MQHIPNKNTAPTFSKTTRKDVIIMESFENVLSVVSGQTLMERTLPPQDYVIRGLLPMGLSIIGGAPKSESPGSCWICV